MTVGELKEEMELVLKSATSSLKDIVFCSN
jgi:hypothetical protein